MVTSSGQPVPDIVIRRHDSYIHIVAQTAVVNRRFMDDLIDALDRALPDMSSSPSCLLIEVGASETSLDLVAAFEVWRRATKKGLAHVRIAYVVRGRPIHPIAKLIETVSKAKHIRLRFFRDSQAALDWLRSDCPVQ